MPKKAAESRDKKKHPFLEAFLFTENGKPKSGTGIYTFCLSAAFIAVYALCYEGAIRLLTGPLSGLTAFLSNLVIALTASALGTFICCLPHRFLKDKRLVFGAYRWLALYAVMVLIAMAVIMGLGEGFTDFLIVFGWFVFLPVAMGLLVSRALYRRDYRPEAAKEPEPEWKKYVRPR